MANSSRPTSVDVVTGKAKVEYFFDPLLLLPNEDASATTTAAVLRTPVKRTNSTNNVNEREVRDALLCGSKHLFMPCVIVKDLEHSNDDDDDDSAVNANAALVKTADGVLHKIRDRTALIPLLKEDYLGIPDVLHLPSVTEASLLHALRLRYDRDEIYTAAGPILISVNPYKSITVNAAAAAITNNNSSNDNEGGTSTVLAGDLYSEERMLKYAQNAVGMPCHLFQVADRAYTSLIFSTTTSSASIAKSSPGISSSNNSQKNNTRENDDI
eukprot:scaffold39136_cov29-Cyclotella_meneghiniana.AAC.1